MYCENCQTVFDSNECPHCGNPNVREPNDLDDCFLVEKEMIWGEMLADVLKQNEIPYYYKTTLGAGIAMKIGINFERCRYYVPYACLSRAQDIVAELFTPVEEGEE